MDIYADILYNLRPVKEPNKKRLGRKWDGGYILSQKILDSSDILLSLGINDEWSFEASCMKAKPFERLIMVDDWGSSKQLVTQFFDSLLEMFYKFYQKDVFKLFKFNSKKILRYVLLKARFHVTYIKTRIGHGPGEMAIDELIKQQNIKPGLGNILLKMDIEGSEYEIIEDMVKGYKNFSGLAIEFHGILGAPDRFRQAILDLKNKFEIIHIHFNNYTDRNAYVSDVVEVSFINKSLVNHPVPEDLPYPIPGLDFPCNPDKADYPIVWI